MRVNIVMYHYVRDLGRSRYPGIKGLDASLFRRQIDFLRSHFTMIRMEDLLFALDGGELPDNAALLTFDDGYIDHYTTVFPILDEIGAQGSFFPPSTILENAQVLDVNKIHFIMASGEVGKIYESLIKAIDEHRGMEYPIPDTHILLNDYAKPNRFDSGEIIFIKRMLQTVLPERLRKIIIDKLFRQCIGIIDEAVFARELYCDVKQLAAMKKHGMYIGLHGSAHDWLGYMEKDEYEHDIRHALEYMDSIGLIDKKAWVMNYPYGSYNDGVVAYVKANGCLAGLTTTVAIADTLTDDKLKLPRLDTNDYPPKSEEYKKY